MGLRDHVEASAELLRDVRTRLGHSNENLPPARLRFDIADDDLQMPLAVLAAPDEGRIQARIDRRCCSTVSRQVSPSWPKLAGPSIPSS